MQLLLIFKKLLLLILLSQSTRILATHYEIEDWIIPTLDSKAPPTWFGDDPVIGRLTCPPLTRLNLQLEKSEGLLVHTPSVISSSKETKWVFLLREGIFFWDHAIVGPKDIASFIEHNLKSAIESVSAGLWKIPAYEVKALEKSVEIHWKEKPVFGPFVLNGFSFFKPLTTSKNGLYYSCAGLFSTTLENEKVLLESNVKYLPKKTSFSLKSKKALQTNQSEAKLVDLKRAEFHKIKFIHANELSSDPSIRPPHHIPKCSLPVELPYVLAIEWNRASPVAKYPAIRNYFTSIIPRGTFLRSGSGSLGQLQSSLIPKDHPGYFQKLLVKPFLSDHLKNKESILRSLKSEKKIPENFSLTSLRLKTQNGKHTLSNLLKDIFERAGITVTFLAHDAKEEYDGELLTWYIPFSGMNFIHSYYDKNAPKSQQLNQLLEDYALSLSYEVPKFSLLQNIHKILYDEEFSTIFYRHNSCLQTQGVSIKSNNINTKDPDWFRKLVAL